MFVGWGLAGGFAEPLGAESPDDARTAEAIRPVLTAPAAVTIPGGGSAASLAAASLCPSTASCGPGCTAYLAVSLCSLAISWEGGIGIGGLQIGPSLRLECQVCDCMYLAPSPAGTVLRRAVKGSCGISIDGLMLQ